MKTPLLIVALLALVAVVAQAGGYPPPPPECNIVPVPEPATWISGGFVAVLLAGHEIIRRRRNRK